MSENLKEPLGFAGQIGRPGHCHMAQIFDADEQSVAFMEPTSGSFVATERVRRICAAVNACAGINTTQLEAIAADQNGAPKKWISALIEATKQRDDLLAALKDLVRGLDETNWSSWQTTARFSEQHEAARDAIAAAEGREVTR